MAEQITLPPFLLSALGAQYGEEITARIIAGMGASRRVSLRVNTLKTDAQTVEKALIDAGLAFDRAAISENAFVLKNAQERALWALPLYERGEIYLQSLSSMLPPLVLCPKPNTDILDMAAAPGGKTTQMAALTNNQASITACEVNKIRADKLKYNLEKQGAGRVNVMVKDARKLEDFFRFDQILLDAPCSGSGTILSGDPSSYRAFSEVLVRNSAAVQLALLKKALTLLKSGHEMVYSTCSILSIENEAVVCAALKGAKAEIVPIAMPGQETLPMLPTTLPGTLCVCPSEEYEGFFVAKIKKN